MPKKREKFVEVIFDIASINLSSGGYWIIAEQKKGESHGLVRIYSRQVKTLKGFSKPWLL